eukprot:12406434-Karenia_brevis.AAC.1
MPLSSVTLAMPPSFSLSGPSSPNHMSAHGDMYGDALIDSRTLHEASTGVGDTTSISRWLP